MSAVGQIFRSSLFQKRQMLRAPHQRVDAEAAATSKREQLQVQARAGICSWLAAAIRTELLEGERGWLAGWAAGVDKALRCDLKKRGRAWPCM